jgi:hypothetical protein
MKKVWTSREGIEWKLTVICFHVVIGPRNPHWKINPVNNLDKVRVASNVSTCLAWLRKYVLNSPQSELGDTRLPSRTACVAR